MSAKELRDLERRYRRERAEILDDPGLSWEKKMRAVSELFERYAVARDELRGAAERRIEWADHHRRLAALFESMAEYHRQAAGRLIDQGAGSG